MIKKLLVAGALMTGMVSCTNDFEEINKNPNVPTEDKVAAEYLFTTALATTHPTGVWQYRLNSLGTEVMAFHTIDAFGNATNYGTNSRGWVAEYWRQSYQLVVNPLVSAYKIVDAGEATDKNQLKAIINTWKAYYFHRMTDMYGDIPFSEAGRVDEGIYKPKFDRQADIYATLISELGDAVDTLEIARGNTSTFGTQDILFDGEYEKWYRFANSLRLRLATRWGDTQAVNEALSKDLIDQVGFNVADRFDSSDGISDGENTNGDYVALAWGEANKPTAAMLNIMQNRNADPTDDDPRLMRYFVKGTDSLGVEVGYKSIITGADYTGAYSNSEYTTINPDYIFGRITPALIMDAGEVYFLKAEALLVTDITAAKEAYKMGVNASLEYYDLDSDVETSYPEFWSVLSANFDTNPKEAIITQKWVALFSNGPEAYAEIRRTGYPTFVEGEDYVGSGQMPTRIDYPDFEYTSNGDNATSAASNTSGFWWD
ncbi:SusD/RagB family nutrient-binding outer membrane lipoprotein [Limibacter armeniacum]|uniref:SusD/RagB family nutrient-binding outer membrane lipoprotein n=1 Tax=Limibacter armeniacum TaxID=466084 RepID=UPI002FE6C4B4